jgi:hypothetical protein
MGWKIFQAYDDGYGKLGQVWSQVISQYVTDYGFSWKFYWKTVAVHCAHSAT